jgi:hypothetical protein
MEGLFQTLIDARTVLNKLSSSPLPHDELVPLQLVCVELCDTLHAMLERQRVCAGPYWRRADGVLAKITRWNEHERKRQKMSESMECVASPTSEFTRNSRGPERESGESNLLCDACGRILKSDQKRGFIC